MKKNLIKLFILGLLCSLVINVGCIDDPERPDHLTGLVGTWDWLETCYPYPADCMTPASAGFDMHMTFSADSVLREYINDDLLATCNFGVIRGQIGGSSEYYSLLTLDCSADTLVILFEDYSTLTLSTGLPGAQITRLKRRDTGTAVESMSLIPTK